MKASIFVLPLLLLFGTPTIGLPGQYTSIAVFDFNAKDMPEPSLGTQVPMIVNATLSSNPNLLLVERVEMDKILSEKELGLSGALSDETSIKMGQLIGAQVLVTGRIFKAGNETLVVTKVIGTETGRVYSHVVTVTGSEKIQDYSVRLANLIAGTIEQNGANLLPSSGSTAERLRRIGTTLSQMKGTAISIRIPEEHFGSRSVDPAVETELGKVFSESGLVVVDGQSDRRPEFEIVGEAFSEFGLRSANLVSCKARVEIKVKERSTGEFVIIDRQTSVATDLSEQIAAKTALQTAGFILAERIADKLAARHEEGR